MIVLSNKGDACWLSTPEQTLNQEYYNKFLNNQRKPQKKTNWFGKKKIVLAPPKEKHEINM